jgi:hypothetical protein
MKCPQCGREFLPRKHNQEFDTDTCRYRWHNERKAAERRLASLDGPTSAEQSVKLDLVELGLLKEKPAMRRI